MESNFLKKTALLLSIFALSFASCDKAGFHDPYDIYHLALFFQDASGNDLVEGIELDLQNIHHDLSLSYGGPVHPDLYTLRWKFPDQCEDLHVGENPLRLMTARAKYNGNRNCVLFSLASEKRAKCSNAIGCITIWLTCPYIFGDNKEHEIETWWDDYFFNDVKRKKCISVIVDGQLFQAKLDKYSEESEDQAPMAIITLNR